MVSLPFLLSIFCFAVRNDTSGRFLTLLRILSRYRFHLMSYDIRRILRHLYYEVPDTFEASCGRGSTYPF
jgi:hypothetical protein